MGICITIFYETISHLKAKAGVRLCGRISADGLVPLPLGLQLGLLVLLLGGCRGGHHGAAAAAAAVGRHGETVDLLYTVLDDLARLGREGLVAHLLLLQNIIE